jgi:antitoxin component YwqK of YwqJK toxin-antitoxin module
MDKRKTEVIFIEKNGRTFSKRTEYFENGQIAEIGLYVNSLNNWSWNIPNGVVRSFYSDGRIKSEVNYDDYGCKDGESNYFDKNGVTIKKRIYSKDVLIKEINLKNSKDNN